MEGNSDSQAPQRFRSFGPTGGEGPRTAIEHDALLRVAAAASAANDLETVLELAATEALHAIGAASLTISRFEQDHTSYRTLINVGQLAEWEEPFPTDEVYAVSDFPRLVEMARTARPCFNAIDDPDCDPASRAFLRSLGKSSDLQVPIVVEGEIWGGLWASTIGTSTSFRSEDVRFLEAVGGQVATAIARAELFSKVSRLAYEDSLTGLANRRALEERLERALVRFAAGETSLALLLCDVDGLKGINDLHGHGEGDQALRGVARALVAAAADHPSAFVARLGGDEFCALLESRERVPDGGELATIEQLGSSTQRLLRLDVPGVSVSCGAATAGPRTASAALLMRAADTAQYVAKRRGGNRVCTAAQIADEPDHLWMPQARVQPAEERLASTAATIARGLGGDLAGSPVLDRLEFVATTLTEAGDFAQWAISIAASGTTYLRELSLGDNRDRRGAGVRVARAHQDYALFELDDFPETAAIIAAGSGSFLARVADPECDRAERELLERDGLVSAVGASAGHEDGVYLLELISDDEHAPLEAAEPVLVLAVQAAMPSHPHRRNAATPSTHNRALELTLSLADRLSGATAEHEVLEAAIEEVQGSFGCSVVHLATIVDGHFELRAERGPMKTPPGWTQPTDAGLIGLCVREGGPVLAVDVEREPQYRATVATRHVRSELVVPVIVAGQLWGVINLEDVEVGAFTLDDVRLLESVAAQIGGALTAIGLYERLDRAYVGTAEALSAALEEKDSYTARHSRSIAKHAVAVGSRLGVEGNDLRMLRYAAAFHDIGKLAISRETLNKPGPLSAKEWAEMSTHTVIGERILGPIGFLAPVRPIVRSAHERWDGSGYPDGLAGERIPLGARIVFACDAYDAMTSDRSYRSAMPPEEALEELRCCAGTQFDPAVVEALVWVVEQGAGQDESTDYSSADPAVALPGPGRGSS